MNASVDVLIVGAGPTGLALAAQLEAFGATFRIIDRQADRVHESRALAIQPRTLEVLAGLGIADTLVERGNPAVRLQMHSPGRTTEVPLFDTGLEDTAYPFLLFLSQAETEAVLDEHLTGHGISVERQVELRALDQRPDYVVCTLHHHSSHPEHLHARYVVGCDGAQSTVRELTGIAFTGAAYPQTFVLADLPARGLDPGAVHVFLSRVGMLFFFPLGHPAPWRLLGMEPRGHARSADVAPDLAALQALADAYTDNKVVLDDAAWATYFRLHHRHADHYRDRRVFLAGDAAHIHSPAGAQGMNTGIQDAWNLGWKLALVARGDATPDLLDTYETERRPVGRDVLRFTDRAFTIATSTNPLVRLARTRLAPRLLRTVLRSRRGRSYGFRALSQLTINYRDSPAVAEGQSRLRHGPKPGDRLPDAPVTLDGHPTTLHRALAAPAYQLLLTGAPEAWPHETLTTARGGHQKLVHTHHLTAQHHPGALLDTHHQADGLLGIDPNRPAHHLVRPDGHIAYRAAGTNLAGLHTYLARWLS